MSARSEILPIEGRKIALKKWRQAARLEYKQMRGLPGGGSLLLQFTQKSIGKPVRLALVEKFEEACREKNITPPTREVWPEIIDNVAEKAVDETVAERNALLDKWRQAAGLNVSKIKRLPSGESLCKQFKQNQPARAVYLFTVEKFEESCREKNITPPPREVWGKIISAGCENGDNEKVAVRKARLREWRIAENLKWEDLGMLEGVRGLIEQFSRKTGASVRLATVERFERACREQNITPPPRDLWPEITDKNTRAKKKQARRAFMSIQAKYPNPPTSGWIGREI